jgi:ribonuclease P protein component
LVKPNDLDKSRLGLVVAKRYINAATKRNRLKRLIREAFRQMKTQIGAHDLIVLINKADARNQCKLWAEVVLQAMIKTTHAIQNVIST